MKNRGFTLIEFMVVVAIIGFLSSITFTIVNQTREKFRDAVRKRDMQQLSNVINEYYLDHGVFPTGYDDTGPANFSIDFSNTKPVDGGFIEGNEFIQELVTTGIIPRPFEDPSRAFPFPVYLYLPKTNHIANIAIRNESCDNTDPDAALLFWLEEGQSPLYSPHVTPGISGSNAICFYGGI